ncbi:pilus (MSHA type) biogenesis protein MshL [Pseudoduganella chitinolytica]|uniref:Type IV pilus biogenesis and competence protein PilQ n=1 Tax=Pseudoduganella chitinolytica TaxID=34070 RepID=A0ABY8BJC4_9BURK|nr:pilus (MSHA type) biogenesis protein MshL [Pseudoduganella chitinolytica]WEF34792.1 pilus (MSHA type) biogenesis protein MshL [Pseudoduganella chitinolytica]
MNKVAATLLCSLLGACGAPQLPISPAHVTEPPRAGGAIPEPVQQSPALPPPRPTPRVETYSVTVHKVPVESVLFALARDAGLNVDIHPSIEGTVTLNALDQTLPQLLDRISRQVDMRYEINSGTLLVLPDQPHWRNYRIDYVNIARTTNSSVNIATQISTTGGSSAGNTSTTGSNAGQGSLPNAGSSLAGGANNNSTTAVSNRADNNFWYSLEKNIRDMLRPTNLNDPLADPLAQLREQTAAVAQPGQPMQPLQPGQPSQPNQAGAYQPAFTPAGQAGGATQPGDYPGAQASAAQGAAARAAQRNAPSVIVNAESGLVAVRATGRQHEKVREFLDIVQSAAKRQVMIEATILEVKLSDQYQQGINWSRISGNGESTLAQGPLNATSLPLAGAVNPNGVFTFNYANPISGLGNIKLAVQLLESFGKVQVLSSPKVSVLNNQTALLKVVDNNVFFTLKVTPAVQNSSGGIAAQATYESRVETVPVGFVMSVTPQISEDDEVTINVRPTITRIVDYVDDPNPELARQNVRSRVPVIQAREVESVMKVYSGQTAVMGGLMQDSVDNAKDGIPLVSRIPVLGNLFAYRNEGAAKTELVIFLRAVVVKDASMEGDYKELRYLLPGKAPLNEQPYGSAAGLPAKGQP